GVAALVEEVARRVARVAVHPPGAPRRRKLLERVKEQGGDALACHRGKNVEHVDRIGALERGEADRLPGYRGDEGQSPGKACREGLLVICGGSPFRLLGRAVIVLGELEDGLSENV